MKNAARLASVSRVLTVTLFLNGAVSLTKVLLGTLTGITAITADGLHSFGDCLSNLVGLIGMRLARRLPDQKHGYGYDRFEAVATLGIVGLISITCYTVIKAGVLRLLLPTVVALQPMVLGVMLASMAVNLFTVWYEGGAGRRLNSLILVADSTETKSDLLVSAGVIASTVLAGWTGWGWLDGAVTLAIGLLMLRVIAEIAAPTVRQLTDVQAVDPDEVARVVLAVEGVRFCHAVRSRGPAEGFFLDLHLGVASGTSIDQAHDSVCHNVKLALKEAFPGLKAANIHLEPDNEGGRRRGNSVFRETDLYDHQPVGAR
jgi:cation diffusion facilitator family transporter